MPVRLPPNLSDVHRSIVRRFVQGESFSQTERALIFEAFDVLDPRDRRSPFDLVVLGFRGDIKTSTYFLHVTRTQGVPHDFYITRVYEREERRHIWVVFLKELTWEAIDGETTPITLHALAAALPGAFRIQQNDTILIILDYEEWKTRVLRVQKAD